MNHTTISDENLEMQKEFHHIANYGIAPLPFTPLIAELIQQDKIKSVSNSRAEKQRLIESLTKLNQKPQEYFPYDPAFPEYSNPKNPDLVCWIDILEHIKPDKIDNVLIELASITTNLGGFCTTWEQQLKYSAMKEMLISYKNQALGSSKKFAYTLTSFNLKHMR